MLNPNARHVVELRVQGLGLGRVKGIFEYNVLGSVI